MKYYIYIYNTTINYTCIKIPITVFIVFKKSLFKCETKTNYIIFNIIVKTFFFSKYYTEY